MGALHKKCIRYHFRVCKTLKKAKVGTFFIIMNYSKNSYKYAHIVYKEN